MRLKYNSNNSGGRWWLKDDDWRALEKAGWYVVWGNLYFCGSGFSFNKKPDNAPDCGKGKQCEGHRRFESADEIADKDRYLGALASNAWKETDSPRDAIKEFERLTGQDTSDEGCNCCGAPHSFSWEDEKGQRQYVGGEDVLPLLYGDGPKTLREAYRRLRGEDD